MKTIELVSKHYGETCSTYLPKGEYSKSQSEKDFKAGVEFAQQWIPITEEHPTHSSWVLVKTDLCRFHCQVCQVRIDKFISTDNFVVANVTHWRPISFL